MDFESELARKLETKHAQMIEIADDKNRRIEQQAEEMRLSILGKDSKNREDKPLEVVDEYVRQNTSELIDPLDVTARIQELQEGRNAYLKELDTQIKVSNATTFVEF